MTALPSALLRQGDLNLWEYFGVALALCAAFVLRRRKLRGLLPFPVRLPVPRRAWQGALIAGLLTLALRAALLPVIPVPTPGVHDEYSFLLQGDTFAHGRLTNPTPVMWPHFESIHIIVRPTYQSMYQPMQGIFLAAGELIGSPWLGVWISCGLMCTTLTWMFYGYLPPRWAFLGGLLAVLRYGIFSYWMNSYFGGATSALGGALVLGAVPRLRDDRRRAWPMGVIAGLGLAMLANSRPYEGLLLAIGVAFTLNFKMLARMIVPAGLVLAIAAAGMAVYFRAVTGNPLELPYEVNRANYGWPMTQFWLTPRPVAFRNQQMRDYYEWESHLHEQFHSPALFLQELWNKERRLWAFFIGPALTLPLIRFGRRAWRDARR